MPLKTSQTAAENSVVFRLGLFSGNPQVETGSLFHGPETLLLCKDSLAEGLLGYFGLLFQIGKNP